MNLIMDIYINIYKSDISNNTYKTYKTIYIDIEKIFNLLKNIYNTYMY